MSFYPVRLQSFFHQKPSQSGIKIILPAADTKYQRKRANKWQFWEPCIFATVPRPWPFWYHGISRAFLFPNLVVGFIFVHSQMHEPQKQKDAQTKPEMDAEAWLGFRSARVETVLLIGRRCGNARWWPHEHVVRVSGCICAASLSQISFQSFSLLWWIIQHGHYFDGNARDHEPLSWSCVAWKAELIERFVERVTLPERVKRGMHAWDSGSRSELLVRFAMLTRLVIPKLESRLAYLGKETADRSKAAARVEASPDFAAGYRWTPVLLINYCNVRFIVKSDRTGYVRINKVWRVTVYKRRNSGEPCRFLAERLLVAAADVILRTRCQVYINGVNVRVRHVVPQLRIKL